jgi:hypothetical protein
VYSESTVIEHWSSLAPVWAREIPVAGNITLHCHTAKDLGMRWVRKDQQYLFAYWTACWSHVTQKVEQYSAYVPQRPFHNSLSSNQTTPNGRSTVILRAIAAYVQQRYIVIRLQVGVVLLAWNSILYGSRTPLQKFRSVIPKIWEDYDMHGEAQIAHLVQWLDWTS